MAVRLAEKELTELKLDVEFEEKPETPNLEFILDLKKQLQVTSHRLGMARCEIKRLKSGIDLKKEQLRASKQVVEAQKAVIAKLKGE